jgi:hypothetical protein
MHRFVQKKKQMLIAAMMKEVHTTSGPPVVQASEREEQSLIVQMMMTMTILKPLQLQSQQNSVPRNLSLKLLKTINQNRRNWKSSRRHRVM